MAARVDDGQLAVRDVRRLGDHRRQRRVGVVPGREQVEQPRAEPRVGDVLRAGGADAGARERAAGGDGRARGRHDGAEHAGPGAAPGQREGHGITAVAVTSTTHSGRASACTTRPVKTGNTPCIRRPSTW